MGLRDWGWGRFWFLLFRLSTSAHHCCLPPSGDAACRGPQEWHLPLAATGRQNTGEGRCRCRGLAYPPPTRHLFNTNCNPPTPTHQPTNPQPPNPPNPNPTTSNPPPPPPGHHRVPEARRRRRPNPPPHPPHLHPARAGRLPAAAPGGADAARGGARGAATSGARQRAARGDAVPAESVGQLRGRGAGGGRGPDGA